MAMPYASLSPAGAADHRSSTATASLVPFCRSTPLSAGGGLGEEDAQASARWPAARPVVPFTPAQYQELEQQALIYKYLVAGVPVPPDLVVPIRRGLDSLATRFYGQPTLGYGPYLGRKLDPEPGRCRRTDGKKWRCSREAHGDSKYCEKHIHRGKSRSRKPVEVTSPAAYRPSAFSISPPRAPDAPPPPPGLGHPQQQHLRHGALSPAGRAPAAGALQLHLDSSLHAASPPPSYHRYAHSHAHYTPPPPPPSLYDYGQSKELREAAELRRRHFHALGADLSLDKPLADAGAAEKPLRRFFDEWPRERGDTRPSWAGAEDATQLSISIPAASPSSDHAASAAARCHNDGSDRCIS